MDKNILLGIIVILFIICLYNNIYDQFRSINEKYENIVQSKYANNMREKTYYEKIINLTSKTVKYLPKMNPGIKLNEYEIYNNTNNLIVSILSKKKKENKEEIKKEPSIFEAFYERVISLKPFTLNSKSLIESATNDPSASSPPASGTTASGPPASGTTASGPPASGPPASGTTVPVIDTIQELNKNADFSSQFIGINIIFWFVCFVISMGVIYVIVKYGEKVFKSMEFFKINKLMELPQTDSNPGLPRQPIGGNNIYYTGGYDINLYSE
jgi:hypothetical protein